MENTAIQVRQSTEITAPMTEHDIKAQVDLIQRVMRSVMQKDEHYGVIPGCGKKPALLKAGAEKLAMTFRLAPEFEVTERDMPGNHREYQVKTTLRFIMNGAFMGQGVGCCSTMEGKYRFRTGDVEFTGKPVPKEYWTARDKSLIGGPGFETKKNLEGKWEIVRAGAKVEHDNPADYYNTVLKMAKKRSLIDAILTSTAASDIFTQDIEESPELFGGTPASTPPPSPPPDEPPRHNNEEPPAPPAGDFEDPEYTLRMELQNMGMAIVAGNVDEFRLLLEQVTSFTAKNGDLVSGVSDVSRLKGTRLKIAHSEMKKKYNLLNIKERGQTDALKDPELPF